MVKICYFFFFKTTQSIRNEECREQSYQEASFKVFPGVHSSELTNKLLLCGLVLDGWVVKHGVEHGNPKAHNVTSVSLIKKTWVLAAVVLSKALHDTVNLKPN